MIPLTMRVSRTKGRDRSAEVSGKKEHRCIQLSLSSSSRTITDSINNVSTSTVDFDFGVVDTTYSFLLH